LKSKTDLIPSNPAAIGSAMTLTSAYDAAKSANSVAPDNTSIAAIKESIDTFLDAAISAVLTAVENLQILVSAIQINYIGPVPTNGNASIQIGDDYYASDGRALVWSSLVWPTLTGGTVAMYVAGQSFQGVLSNAAKTATFELSKSQTNLITAGAHPLEIVATLASGHVVTLVSATLIAE
jgi:hypothetical protein